MADDIIPHYPFRTSYWSGALYEYHHEPREIWLAKSGSRNSTARATECDGSGEDPTCSDSVELLELSGEDHTTYFAPLDAGPCFV